MKRVRLTGMNKVGCSHTLLDRMIKLTNVPEQRHVGHDKKTRDRDVTRRVFSMSHID
jgi:hypothetical protein